jgi:hypothetical protein
MLHAVIRSDRDALHFFGEVSGYNLQTLRQYVRQSVRDGGPLQVRLEIETDDQTDFVKHTQRWLPTIVDAGAMVEVEVLPSHRLLQR